MLLDMPLIEYNIKTTFPQICDTRKMRIVDVFMSVILHKSINVSLNKNKLFSNKNG